MASAKKHKPEHVLLRPGDTVSLYGLKKTELNNATAKVVAYRADKRRYRCALPGRSKSLAVRRRNLQLIWPVSDPPVQIPKIHLLLACHLESKVQAFCAVAFTQSLLRQRDLGFSVFIGLSGDNFLCTRMLRHLHQIAAGRTDISFFALDDEFPPAKSQFEHFRTLLHVSKQIASDAWLLFSSTNDLFHPMRILSFRRAIEKSTRWGPICIPRKLIVFENPEDRCIETGVMGFKEIFSWESAKTQTGKKVSEMVKEVSARNCRAAKASLFYDWAVQSAYFNDFLAITPRGVTSNKSCGMRFNAQLEAMLDAGKLAVPIETDEWLYAQRKLSHQTSGSTSSNESDTALGHIQIVENDQNLAKKFKLAASLVAMCREEMTSYVVRFHIWYAKSKDALATKVAQFSLLHGEGFGEALAVQIVPSFEELFSEEQRQRNGYLFAF